MKRWAAGVVGAFLRVLLAAGCESAPTNHRQSPSPSQVTQPAGGSAVNVGPAHDFFYGLTGDGCVPYTVYSRDVISKKFEVRELGLPAIR